MLTWSALPSQQVRHFSGGPAANGSLTILDDASEERLAVPNLVARRIHRDKDLQSETFATKDQVFQRLDGIARQEAHAYALRLLQKREYAVGELEGRLLRQGFSATVANDITQRLMRANVVNDVRFAEAFTNGKVHAGWGLQRIERELKARGIDASSLPGWPYDYVDPSSEYDRAIAIAERKHVRPPNEFAKLVRFLMGRGFSRQISIDAARSVLDED